MKVGVMAVLAWAILAISHMCLRLFMDITPTAIALSSVIIPVAMSAYYSGWFIDHSKKVDEYYAEDK